MGAEIRTSMLKFEDQVKVSQIFVRNTLKKAKILMKTVDGEILQTSIVDRGTSEAQQEPFEVVVCRWFTSSVPVARRTFAAIVGHFQERAGNPQNHTVEDVPRESSAVPNRFDALPGLEPRPPGAPVGLSTPAATLAVISRS